MGDGEKDFEGLWLELAREMEADILEILLCHLENVSRVGQENIAALAVLGHILVLALLEGFQLSGVIAFNPAGFVEADGLPATLGVVFVFEAILNHFKLQLTDGADNLAAIELVDK